MLDSSVASFLTEASYRELSIHPSIDPPLGTSTMDESEEQEHERGRRFGSSVASRLSEPSYSNPPIHRWGEDDGRGGGRAGRCFGGSVASGLSEPSYSNPPIHRSVNRPLGARTMDESEEQERCFGGSLAGGLEAPPTEHGQDGRAPRWQHPKMAAPQDGRAPKLAGPQDGRAPVGALARMAALWAQSIRQSITPSIRRWGRGRAGAVIPASPCSSSTLRLGRASR